jgi:7-cyano-7-deazaguanine synthase
MKNNKAVVLLSGGLDSAVALYVAQKKGFDCLCLIFDYGQRHRKEIRQALEIARQARCPAHIVKISLPWKGSALLDNNIKMPQGIRAQEHKGTSKLPSTYVPARNIIFLSFALSCAEAIKAKAIFIGAHIQDYSGYPDCRPEFFRAFSKVMATGTGSALTKQKINIQTPLINKHKAEIIKLGLKLKVPLALTWSCYRGLKYPCGVCDSCLYRKKGFQEAGIKDPALKT